MLTVTLSNRFIRAAEGEFSGSRLSVKRVCETVDNEGCIVGGMIVDHEGLASLLRDFWEGYGLPVRGVRLILDSSLLSTRVLEAPAMTPEQTVQYLEREFADLERVENPRIGYCPLAFFPEGKKGLRSLLAMQAPEEYLTDFVKLFAEIGVTVESVVTSVGAALLLTEHWEPLRRKTCIIQFIDDVTLISVLRRNGRTVYFSRSRLFAEPGTAEFLGEAARTISNLLPFARTQGIEEPLEEIYVSGMNETEMADYQETVRQIRPGLLALPLFTQAEEERAGCAGSSRAAVAIGGLVPTDKKTDILRGKERRPGAILENIGGYRWALIFLAASAIVFVGLTAVQGVRVFRLSRSLAREQEYLSEVQNEEDAAEYDSLHQTFLRMNDWEAELRRLEQTILTYPKVDSSVTEAVSRCAEGLVTAQIKSYDSVTGVLQFDVTAADSAKISRFVGLLASEEAFSRVDYGGYTQESGGEWSVDVTAVLAGREETQE